MRMTLLVVLATGCSASEPSGGCDANEECAAGKVCVDQQCEDLCVAQADCSDQEFCSPEQICLPRSSGALPEITDVLGNDPSDPTQIVNGLIILGNELGGAAFELRDQSSNPVGMSIGVQDQSRVEAFLPADIVSGVYAIVATNAAGEAQAGVTLTLPELTPDTLLDRLNMASGTVSVSRLPVGAAAGQVASGSHNHDSTYYTQAAANSTFSPAAHNHDSAYYPQSQADATFVPMPAGCVDGDLLVFNSGVVDCAPSPGVAKAWVTFAAAAADCTAGLGGDECTIRSAFNVGRVIRLGAGRYSLELNPPFANTDYALVATATREGTGANQGGELTIETGTKQAGQVIIASFRNRSTSSEQLNDVPEIAVVIFAQ